MSVEYKLVRRPGMGKTDVKQPLYPCFAPWRTVRLDDLAKMAQGRSSFSSADIKGMLQLLQDLIVDALKFGQCIELEGIGTFGISLKSRPVLEEKEIRAESIRFQDVTFRSAKELRDRLRTMQLERSSEKAPVGFTPEVCEQRTLEYLKTHPYITGKEYRNLCRCGKTKAAADLKKMMLEGKLVRTFVGNAYLFRLPVDEG
ncbi:MAG: DNA-binding protein [Parabacteroides sp.]|nr:DNA-binding protein [Parabacteroides sp.]